MEKLRQKVNPNRSIEQTIIKFKITRKERIAMNKCGNLNYLFDSGQTSIVAMAPILIVRHDRECCKIPQFEHM